MPHEHGAHSGDHSTDESDFAEMLDLDGAVLHGFWDDVLADLRRAIGDTPPAQVLDIGAGTGTGTINLARCFGDATITAVDASEEMLRRIRAKADESGIAERVDTVHADLDESFPVAGPIDLTWASMSLHHVGDPDRLLAQVFAVMRPGGVVAVIEMTDELRFLPDELGFGPPGLERRCLDMVRADLAASLPHLGSDWAARLTTAGFTVLGERSPRIDLSAPHGPLARRYAQLWLARVRSGLAGRLTPSDDEALAHLLDGSGPESLASRDDLHIRGGRSVILARRG